MSAAPGLPLLFVSNGHGEDEIACRILAALRATGQTLPPVEAWPMVGAGAAYRALGVPVVGPANTLPGEGFSTLSLRLFLRDLRAGWIGTHVRQLAFARGLRGRYRLLVGVGDVVPLAAGFLTRTPMAFVSCAKSAFYARSRRADGHTGPERWLMRRCRDVFPRDRLTAERLRAHGVPNSDLGNPMMDGLEAAEPTLTPRAGCAAVAMLPGSRSDATDNALLLLAAAAVAGAGTEMAPRFLFACHPAVDLDRVAATACAGGGWQQAAWDHPLAAPHLCLTHAGGAKALLLHDAFAAVLAASTLAVGMAGTANEQAVGCGLPLIVVPGRGNQGESYVRMKMRWFGPAALRARPVPEEIAAAIAALLADPARRAAMAREGRARMGPPGASRAIALAILGHLGDADRGGGDAA